MTQDIENPDVLRRVLQELNDSIPQVDVSLIQVTSLAETATLADVISRFNQLAEVVNSLSLALSVDIKEIE